MLHEKEALIFWLQKFVLSCTIFWYFLQELFTIFWCNSRLIMVQLRTNFCSQKISASFWFNPEQNFLECIIFYISKNSNNLIKKLLFVPALSDAVFILFYLFILTFLSLILIKSFKSKFLKNLILIFTSCHQFRELLLYLCLSTFS